MIEREPFVVGLLRIAEAVRQVVTDSALEVYHDSLGPGIEAEEWDRFARWVVDTDRFQWFPKLSELRDALRDFRGEPDVNVEAVVAYERVIESGTYTAEGGTTWAYRTIMERCGKAAAEAFLAAGGHHAFANTFRENDRRTAFVEAYAAHARAVPCDRMLPAGEQKLLLAASTARPLTRDEAKELLRPIMAAAPKPQEKRRWISLDDPNTAARVEVLREQGRRLVAEEPEKGAS